MPVEVYPFLRLYRVSGHLSLASGRYSGPDVRVHLLESSSPDVRVRPVLLVLPDVLSGVVSSITRALVVFVVA